MSEEGPTTDAHEIVYCPVCGEQVEPYLAWSREQPSPKIEASAECSEHGEMRIEAKWEGDEEFDPYKYSVAAFAPEETNGKCHICGEEFDAEQWDERHISGGPSAGETWKYGCPNCLNETIEVGT